MGRKKSVNHLAKEPHTTYQDLKRVDRFEDTDSYMPFTSAESDVIETGKYLIPIKHLVVAFGAAAQKMFGRPQGEG